MQLSKKILNAIFWQNWFNIVWSENFLIVLKQVSQFWVTTKYIYI